MYGALTFVEQGRKSWGNIHLTEYDLDSAVDSTNAEDMSPTVRTSPNADSCRVNLFQRLGKGYSIRVVTDLLVRDDFPQRLALLAVTVSKSSIVVGKASNLQLRNEVFSRIIEAHLFEACKPRCHDETR